jgi:hypothetical protein
MAHPWFESIDWQDLYNKKVKAPYTPQLDDPSDVKHFCPGFTSKDPYGSNNSGSPASACAHSNCSNKWDDFSYGGSSLGGRKLSDEDDVPMEI